MLFLVLYVFPYTILFFRYLSFCSSLFLLFSSHSSSPCYSSPSRISFSCRSISSSALSSSSRLNLSSRIASSGKDLGSLVFAVDFDFDIFGLNNCQATPHIIGIVSFSKGKFVIPLHPFLISCTNFNVEYSPLPVHEKILLVDKGKAKYCYLTFSMIISFFSDNFSRLHLRELCYTGHGRKAKIGWCISLFNRYPHSKDPIC